MDKFYDPKKVTKIELSNEEFDNDYIDNSEVLNFIPDGLFKVGPTYEDRASPTAVCKTCGGNVFNVAIDSYFTAIKCVVCEWEKTVHEG